jgi:spore coat polysaccharide biosynthesis predicted glycosyltransferase SpsG
MTHVVRGAFRTGGGRRIGFGHVHRCLSLEVVLRAQGAQILFLLDGDFEVCGWWRQRVVKLCAFALNMIWRTTPVSGELIAWA